MHAVAGLCCLFAKAADVVGGMVIGRGVECIRLYCIVLYLYCICAENYLRIELVFGETGGAGEIEGEMTFCLRVFNQCIISD